MRWPTSEMLLGPFGSQVEITSWEVFLAVQTNVVHQLGEQDPMSPYQCEAWKLEMGRLGENFSPCALWSICCMGWMFGCLDFLQTRVTGREVSWSRASFSAQAELWCLVFLEFVYIYIYKYMYIFMVIYVLFMYIYIVYIYIFNIHNPCAPDSLRNL